MTVEGHWPCTRLYLRLDPWGSEIKCAGDSLHGILGPLLLTFRETVFLRTIKYLHSEMKTVFWSRFIR